LTPTLTVMLVNTGKLVSQVINIFTVREEVNANSSYPPITIVGIFSAFFPVIKKHLKRFSLTNVKPNKKKH